MVRERRVGSLPVTPAEEAVRESCGQTNSSSPRKRGSRGKRLKSLGSRFRGNDEKSVLTAMDRNWITASCAGVTGIYGNFCNQVVTPLTNTFSSASSAFGSYWA